MEKKLLKVNRLIPCSVVFLSVGTDKKVDAITATATFISENPLLVTVSVAKHIISHELIESLGEFALNVASVNQVELAHQLGSTHGREVDKIKKFGVSIEKASEIKSPLIKGSFANIECKVITSIPVSNYTLYLAEVVAYKVDDKLFPIAWYDNKYFALKDKI